MAPRWDRRGQHGNTDNSGASLAALFSLARGSSTSDEYHSQSIIERANEHTERARACVSSSRVALQCHRLSQARPPTSSRGRSPSVQSAVCGRLPRADARERATPPAAVTPARPMLATTGIGLRGEGTFFHRLPTVNMISPTVQACKNSTCHWPCGVHRRAAEAERDRGRARRERRGARARLAAVLGDDAGGRAAAASSPTNGGGMTPKKRTRGQ